MLFFRLHQLGQVLPEEVPAIDDLAAAHVEEVHGEHVVFVVIAEDIRVVVVRAGDALLLLHLVHGDEQVAIFRCKLELLGGRSCFHARFERAPQLLLAAFEEELRIAHRLAVFLRCGESFDAGAEATLDVVLQAGSRVVAGEIDLAARQQERAVQQVRDAMCQIAGEVGTVVSAAVLAQAARDEDLRIAIGQRELDVGIRFVVAQQDVEARLALLDEVVFKRERFAFVVDQDVIDIYRLAHQRAGLRVGLRGRQQIRADTRAQVLRLADVDDLALGVLVQVHAGLRGQGADFLLQVHFGVWVPLGMRCAIPRRGRSRRGRLAHRGPFSV